MSDFSSVETCGVEGVFCLGGPSSAAMSFPRLEFVAIFVSVTVFAMVVAGAKVLFLFCFLWVVMSRFQTGN
jgi:hypothetical protein